ncbi:MAG: YihA family ribosome biogenesis GTP-binding protein [Bacteroidales bacterium]|nr:YihA family ribosome biogenesis GTP-binding protein [Bacteroidales bacterium]MBN2819393.1 YihA family ribosome biogenesis GTP-binding protein [Bacteroidales bacterium]
MKINTVEFVKSSAKLDQCPETRMPEYAFVGRSNVGKSSLINALTGRKKLALTSGNPGKTRLINHFLVNKDWFLVDLPGYGYAKLSKKERELFDPMIKQYLSKRESMACLFLLIDIRHDPIAADLEFLNWLGENMIPFSIVFTKSDKLSKTEISTQVENYKKVLLESWESLPGVFITSSKTSEGKEELLNYIEDTNRVLKSK